MRKAGCFPDGGVSEDAVAVRVEGTKELVMIEILQG